jgi:small redox-active disulfide protein 2
MKIHILGGGCAKCRQLEENTRSALQKMGIEADIEHIRDSDEIMELGVLTTPALMIDKTVKAQGKVLSEEEVIEIVQSKQ